MADEFIYTDEQVNEWGRLTEGLPMCGWRGQLEILHKAGITVTFPEPRFFVERGTDHKATPRWYVCDREDGHASVAWFYGPDSEAHAREHADRLNREVQPAGWRDRARECERERDEARKDRDDWRMAAERWQSNYTACLRERDTDRTDSDRYRKALEQIAHPPSPTPTRSELFLIARRALGGGGS